MHRLIHCILRALLASPASCLDSPIDLSLLKSDDPAGYSGEYSMPRPLSAGGVFSRIRLILIKPRVALQSPRVLQLASRLYPCAYAVGGDVVVSRLTHCPASVGEIFGLTNKHCRFDIFKIQSRKRLVSLNNLCRCTEPVSSYFEYRTTKV